MEEEEEGGVGLKPTLGLVQAGDVYVGYKRTFLTEENEIYV